jgi:hypothetical protein
VQVQNIVGSHKKAGIYETRIIERLTRYFEDKGYTVISHAQLNISYGSILSELDMLLEKKGWLTYVEVKSHRDKLDRAFRQIDRVRDYVDYTYVATTKRIVDWHYTNIGLIVVQEEKVRVTKPAKRFTSFPRYSAIFSLRKKCLLKFLQNGQNYQNCLSKYELVRYVLSRHKKDASRECLKEIVTCGKEGCITCPILRFVT